MTRDDCRWAVMSVLEKYWDKRMPDRDVLYDLFYKELDPAFEKLLDEIDRKEAEVDAQHMRGVTK